MSSRLAPTTVCPNCGFEFPGGELTEREIQVLTLLAEKRSTKEIARTLGVTAHTIKNHLTSIFHRSGTQDRLGAMLWAIENGYVIVTPKSGALKLRASLEG